LLDGRPAWAGGKLNASSILLEPLSDQESSALISALAAGTELSSEAGRRIAETAEGNPLFLEQMLAMVAESGDQVGELVLPPAIQALLAARLDHLAPDERRLLECASVEGEVFHVSGVVELSSSDTPDAVRSQLMSLVRKELIRPEVPVFPGDEAFGFRHALIRDAAYASLPKQARADLHERYAAWLERALGDRVVEGEEFLAYHLEQAHRHSVELDAWGEATDALAARAGELLASAGRRAFMRGDWPATVNLWERALGLLSAETPLGRQLMPDLALALLQMGNVGRADAVAEEAIAAGEAMGDVAVQAGAAVTRTYCGWFLRPEQWDGEAARREAEDAFSIFDKLDDDAGRTRAIFNIDIAEWSSGSADGMGRSAERGIRYARRAGIRPDELECCAGLCWSTCFGTTPADVGRQRIEEVVLGAGGDRALEALAATFVALLDGMEGRLPEARARVEEGRRALAELGLQNWVGFSAVLDGLLAELATDFVLAEQVLREMLEQSTPADRLLIAWGESGLARALQFQQRYEDALALTQVAEGVPLPAEPWTHIRRCGARALALGATGRLEEAETLARNAVELARRTDFLNARGDTLVDLAEILTRGGRPEEAASTLEEAVSLYEIKGNIVSAAKARALLENVTAVS
jgi:tetratricopeptide (TPR) repeat protein